MFRIDFAGETEDLIMETACNLVVNTTFQSTTNQMTIQYKSNHDYDTERLVFTYKHGRKIIKHFSDLNNPEFK